MNINSNWYNRYGKVKGRLVNDGDPVHNHKDTNRQIRGYLKTLMKKELKENN